MSLKWTLMFSSNLKNCRKTLFNDFVARNNLTGLLAPKSLFGIEKKTDIKKYIHIYVGFGIVVVRLEKMDSVGIYYIIESSQGLMLQF